MKRILLWGALLVGASVLGGCPIYPEDPYACASNADCPNGYACDYPTGVCYLVQTGPGPTGKTCTKPTDCGANETCSKTGKCGVGDCTFHGCVAGYSCEVAGGVWGCVSSQGTGGAGGSSGGGGTAGASSGGAAGSAGAAGAGGTAGSPNDAGTDSSTGGTAGGTGSDAASDTSID